MNLEQLRAWLDAHGGYKESLPTTRSVTKKTPAGDTTSDEAITIMVAVDGSQISVRGTGEDMYEVVGEPKLAPPKTASASNVESVSAPPTQPNIVSRRPDGTLDVQPNPNAAAAQNTPAGERAAQEQVERQRNSQAIGIPLTDPDKAAWDVARAKEQQATDERGRAEARQQRLDIESSANRIWTQNLQERQQAGTEAERARVAAIQQRQQGVAENAPIKIGEEIFAPKRDETGAITEVQKIPGTPPPGGNAPPDIGALKVKLGNIVPELEERHRRYQELVAASDGKYTQDDVKKWMDRDRAMAQAEVDQTVAILNGQQNIRSQDITQRGQTLQDQGNRQQLASTAATNAIKAMNDLGPALGKQPPGAVGRVIDYYKGLYTDMAKSLGVPAETPAAVPRTTAQQGLMDTVPQGITINIGGSPNTAPAGGPQGLSGLQTQMSAGLPPALANTVAGGGPGYDPMNPAGLSQATTPSQVIDQYRSATDQNWNTALDQIQAELPTPPGGAQTVGEHQRFAGGQLRTPGAGPVGAGPVGAVG